MFVKKVFWTTVSSLWMGYKAAMEDELCVWGLAWTFVVKSVLWSICLFVIQWSGQIATFFWGGCASNYCFENDWLFGVCVAECEAFCTRICVSVVYRVFSLCVVVFLFVVIGSMSCQARILVGFCFFCGFLDVEACLSLDMVLFGSLAVVMRCVPQFMLEASFRHADVYLLLQGSCGIFPSRSASICRRLVSTRGKSLAEQLCCVLCVVCLSRRFKCFVFVPRVHRFPEHMVSMFISGLNDKPSHSARLHFLPRED